MTDLILHHYDISPYAEKIRLIFGAKGLAWKSVQIPVVMPKPDLTELTGGYRRTPTLQIGADVYCDTKIIARTLERLHPEPSLVPPGHDAILPGLARFGESSFMMMVAVMLGQGMMGEDFIEDRKKMAPDVDFEQTPRIVPAKLLQLRANVARLEAQLGDGRAYLLGDALSLADLAAYHPLWPVPLLPATKSLLDDSPHVRAWMERIAAVGHGTREELDAADAIAIARDAEPSQPTGEPVDLPDGLAVGDRVVVIAEEVGSGVVAGELLPSDVHEIAILRQSERAGELVVHFPRDEYLVVRA